MVTSRCSLAFWAALVEREGPPLALLLDTNPRVIERSVGRIKDFRAIVTRYDKTARDFLAGICLAAVLLWWISWV
jgi:hypothetical protein